MTGKETFLSRYLSGDFTSVWADMNKLEESVRDPKYFHDAYSTARETMRRVRKNIETIIHRLTELGYQFEYPDEVHIPPNQETENKILEIEESIGIFPLSLRAFYHEVGSVNLVQSFQQIVHFYRPEERARLSDLYILGEEDPLVVMPLEWLIYDINPGSTTQHCCFAPDEFHKANYSGGENYHVTIPNPNADFAIEGMYGMKENFIDYLRESFRYGGFRGKVSTIFDPEIVEKISPQLDVINTLKINLIPF